MEYSLTAGGKRLRPILVIAGAQSVGGQAEKVMPLAVAIEMIHTFSLMHDDLPAMDDDDLRRGKPTSHKKFGEAKAILGGDALLAEAFYALAHLEHAEKPELIVEVIRDVAAASGARGMTGGQLIDIESTNKTISEAELEQLHAYKTGRLITVPVIAGAKLSGADTHQLLALQKYGEALGLAFQITDDILDIEGNEAEIGKNVGSDIDKNKSTYPALLGMAGAKKKASQLVAEAFASLCEFGAAADPLRWIARYVVERKQ
jgi:geranylgeranyl diphosphate synthase type II